MNNKWYQFQWKLRVMMHIENIFRFKNCVWLNNQKKEKKRKKLYNHTQKIEKIIKLKKRKDIQFEIFVTNKEIYLLHQW